MPDRSQPPRKPPSRQPAKPEKLQKGGPRRTSRKEPMTFAERVKEYPERRRKRRAAKKRRLAKMTPRRRWARRIGVIATWLLTIVALFMSVTAFLFYSLTDVPRPEDLPLPKTATIEYADGSVMARQFEQNRTIVHLDQVPDHVRWAVLAAEDRSFYSEPGVSIKGTLRAAFTDLTGGDTQGGSGITQQYVKNAYLNNARSLSRKLKELMIAMKLAREYSKNQILEFYLNTVYFGRGAYGIEAAAQVFFDRDIKNITVAQGAVLASQLRAPSYYDPANNLDAAKGRWQYVIDGMVSTGHLTRAQADALKYPDDVAKIRNQEVSGGPTQLIVQRVLAELQANGIDESELYSRGLTIRTTINKAAQIAAVSAVKTTFANLTAQQKNFKNALVAVDPKTGAVLAYYGGPNGKNYAGKTDQFDWAGIGSRPPGSSFKPYTLATVLTQTVKKAEGKPNLTISSYVNGSYCVNIEGHQICNDPGDQSVSSKAVTVSNAMKYSLNTTFDLLAVQAGPNNVANIAHATGISKKDANGNPTLQDENGDTGFDIGIGGYAVHPIDQAVGFSTFANGGVHNPAYFVQTVTDSEGHVVFRHKSQAKRVLDLKVANDVTRTMLPIAAWSNDALAEGRISAAKTGTQGIPGGSANSDAWMVGFTPQVSVAVWAGSGNSTTPIYNSYGGAEYGSDLPGKTWKLFMDTYLAGKPNMPMATTQLITGGQNQATPSPTKTPTKSTSPTASTSGTPTPTLTPTSPGPTTPTPTPTPTCTPVGIPPKCKTP